MTGAVFRAYSRRRSNAREVSSRSAPCWLCSTHTQVASRFGVVLTQKFAAQALGGASVISRIFRRQHRGISTVRSWKWHMERTLYGRNMSVLLRSTERVFQAFQGYSETGPADCHFLPQLVEIKMNERQLSRRHFTLCAAVGFVVAYCSRCLCCCRGRSAAHSEVAEYRHCAGGRPGFCTSGPRTTSRNG